MIFQDFGADQGKRQWSDLRYLSVLNPTRHVAIHLICGLFVTISGQQIAIRKPLLRKYSIVYYCLVECFLIDKPGRMLVNIWMLQSLSYECFFAGLSYFICGLIRKGFKARYHNLSELEINEFEIISHTTRTTNLDQNDFQPFIKHFVQ